MKIRAKLLMVIAALMGITFMVAAMLLQAQHLRRQQQVLQGREDLVRHALNADAGIRHIEEMLGGLKRGKVISRWAVACNSGKTIGDDSLLESYDGSKPASLVSGVCGMLVRTPEGGQLQVVWTTAKDGVGLLAVGSGGMLLVMLFGAALLGTVVYLMVSRLVLSPVDEMLLATHRMAAGDFASTVKAGGSDEVGRLASAFNSMSKQLLEARELLEQRVLDATAKVEKSQKELAFADRLAATGRLAAGVAHEINSPLSGVINAVKRLQQGDLSKEKEQQYLELVADGLERMGSIVRLILDFSRRKPEIRAVDIAEPVQKAVELARHHVEKQGIKVIDTLPSSAVTMADEGELEQVFLNLVTNAIDAMPEGGILSLTGGTSASEIWVDISDNGCGMDAEELSASFDRFHTTKPAGKGTGLGLSISFDIVNRYGGNLTLESTRAIGTTARVLLPRRNDCEGAPR